MLNVYKIIPTIVLSGMMLSLNASQPASRDINTTVSVFLKAIHNGDIKALVSVTRFPIESNEFGKIKNADELKSKFKLIFTKERRMGLIGQNPVKLKECIYSIGSRDESDPIQFLFKKIDEKYKLYSIDNVNE